MPRPVPYARINSRSSYSSARILHGVLANYTSLPALVRLYHLDMILLSLLNHINIDLSEHALSDSFMHPLINGAYLGVYERTRNIIIRHIAHSHPFVPIECLAIFVQVREIELPHDIVYVVARAAGAACPL